MFMTVGIIISIFGFIAGIVTGSATHNFLFCLWVWIGTFLYALIYFGFAAILQAIAELKVQMNSRLDAIANAEAETVSVMPPAANIPYNQNNNSVAQSAPAPSPAAPVITKKPVDDWVCPKCGNRNSKIVTKCLNCDAEKPEPPVGNNAPKFQFLKSETESPKRPGNDWICPKCGSKNSRLVTKCMTCDALLVSDK